MAEFLVHILLQSFVKLMCILPSSNLDSDKKTWPYFLNIFSGQFFLIPNASYHYT
jgi:hypothetical protein